MGRDRTRRAQNGDECLYVACVRMRQLQMRAKYWILNCTSNFLAVLKALVSEVPLIRTHSDAHSPASTRRWPERFGCCCCSSYLDNWQLEDGGCAFVEQPVIICLDKQVRPDRLQRLCGGQSTAV